MSCGEPRFIKDFRRQRRDIETKAASKILEAPDLALMVSAQPPNSQRHLHFGVVVMFCSGGVSWFDCLIVSVLCSSDRCTERSLRWVPWTCTRIVRTFAFHSTANGSTRTSCKWTNRAPKVSDFANAATSHCSLSLHLIYLRNSHLPARTVALDQKRLQV